MDLEALKAKRDARIQAKKDRIKLDSGAQTEAPTEASAATEEKK